MRAGGEDAAVVSHIKGVTDSQGRLVSTNVPGCRAGVCPGRAGTIRVNRRSSIQA